MQFSSLGQGLAEELYYIEIIFRTTDINDYLNRVNMFNLDQT